ncbi:FAD binding domain-containing protein [Demequina muriae]|uniref:FAD binding domain-containing protein n=1 Tax=Demequina muriae TaxID=3051664 RepID=A0ABT8GID3_9MICO|nr:FAD binding domain-containing protein [Demequina sp. EGI L300058]MDN4481198.1 FAD binding domain-containing protein [Demequina sp. EGI L300058]
MDLTAVQGVRVARSRADLALVPGERYLAGGTWLFSEDQPGVTGLVDLSALGWDELAMTAEGGLRIGAMTTIGALERWAGAATFPAAALFGQCAESLLASAKVRAAATVGGNIVRSYAASSMVALAATLDATATIWSADGTERVVPVADLPTGNGTTALAATEVLRDILFPASALGARTAHRRIALAQHGRSGALLTGRRDADGACTFVITAATLTPTVLRYPTLPPAATLDADVRGADGYYTDPLGTADWRRQVSAVLLAEVREELVP